MKYSYAKANKKDLYCRYFTAIKVLLFKYGAGINNPEWRLNATAKLKATPLYSLNNVTLLLEKVNKKLRL